jgi:hypothetical protein
VLYAVEISGWNSILFMAERPPSGDWTVAEGVEIDVPVNFDLWPEEAPQPDQTLCRSTTNPNHYKVFKYSSDIDRSEFEPTGKGWGGIYSKRSFERLVTKLPILADRRDVPDDDAEPINTPTHSGTRGS